AMYIERLASASEVTVSGAADMDGEDFSGAVQVITDAARIFIPMEELVDKEKELARLEKERKACEKDINMVSQKLSSQGFLDKAPAQVVEAERVKLEKHKERMEKILESIAAFSK
ncbi:MAG: valine--tRNA ligase, partial [Oscillospiraceae bacterium]|nr:valine--tRNA ligase [Oscillospiraceae bacterium]